MNGKINSESDFNEKSMEKEALITPKKILTEKSTVQWVFGYRIKSLNHQLIRYLEPILIKI